MRWWPKTYFKWREPNEFLRRRDATEKARRRWWHQPLGTLLMVLLALGQWYVARFIPGKRPPPFPVAIALAVAYGVLVAYIVPWIYTMRPSEVRLSEKMLVRIRLNTQWRIKYQQMESFSWQWQEGVAALTIRRRKGREILVGVPETVSRQAIDSFLVSRGVTPRDG